MATLLTRVDIIVVLVLHLLVLLLQLSRVLLHLLRTGPIVAHVVQVHLLLNVDVVLGGCALLLCLHHHLMAACRLVRIHGIWVRVLGVLAAHWLGSVVHQEVALVVLPILLVTTRVGVLAWSIAQRSHNHILYIIVDGQIDGRLLHFRLLLGAAAASHRASTLLATSLMRQY